MEVCKVEITDKNTSLVYVRNLETLKLKRLPKNEAIKAIGLLIVSVSEYFGVAWSLNQIKELAEELHDAMQYWGMADLKLFSKRVKGLYYGKLFGTFAPAHLMEWANQYDNEWIEASETIAISKHNEYKKTERDIGGTNEQTKLRDFLKNDFKS